MVTHVAWISDYMNRNELAKTGKNSAEVGAAAAGDAMQH